MKVIFKGLLMENNFVLKQNIIIFIRNLKGIS